MKKMIQNVLTLYKGRTNKREKEYSKRLLNHIAFHSVIMMYCTYILAWFEKIAIAETLSKTSAPGYHQEVI